MHIHDQYGFHIAQTTMLVLILAIQVTAMALVVNKWPVIDTMWRQLGDAATSIDAIQAAVFGTIMPVINKLALALGMN